MSVPLQSNSAAYLSRQAAKMAADTAYKVSRMKTLPGLANGLSDILKRSAYIQGKVAKPLTEIIKQSKQGKDILDALGKGANKGKSPNLAQWAALGLSIATLGILVGDKIVQNFLRDIDEGIRDRMSADLTKAYSNISRAILSNRKNAQDILKLNAEVKKYNSTISSQNQKILEARKLGNNALAEARSYNKSLQQRINEFIRNSKSEIQKAYKIGNDALAETRSYNRVNQQAIQNQALQIKIQNENIRKQKLEYASQISILKKQFDGLANNVKQQTTNNLSKIIQEVKFGVSEAQKEAKAAKDFAATVARTLELSKALTDALQKKSVETASIATNAAKTANNAVQEVKKIGTELKTYVSNIQRATVQEAVQIGAKVYEGRLKQAEEKVGFLQEQVIRYGSNNLQKIETVESQISKLEENFKKVGTDIKTNEKQTSDIKTDLNKIGTKLGEYEKLDKQANDKLDKLSNAVAALPPLIRNQATNIKTSIPTIPQITTATETAICNSAANGCLKTNLDGATNQINNNINDKFGALNAALNTVDLGLLKIIDKKLGAQLEGGLSGFLQRLSAWKVIDRVLNILTFATTLHNAQMLSVNLGQSLVSVVDNILAIFNITNSEGQPYELSTIIGTSFERMMKNVLGETEWGIIKLQWAALNRIYQAGSNTINEIRNVGSSIVNAVEQTARLTGKGFNALQDDGILSESNWNYTPEELKLKGGLFAKLGKLSDGINVATEGLEAIESITSEIRSAVDSAKQIKEEAAEIDKSVKELIGQSTTKREEEVAALPPKNYSWEDLI